MKNTIYKYIFSEFLRYFIITLFALAIIIWTIQAVNFLDLVTQDGHSFLTYSYYSLLTLSKVFTKLIPFCFLISLVLTIIKLEKDNELIIIWTSGLNKINIVKLFIRISLIVMILQLCLTTLINPKFLNKSRDILKKSELQFIPSLLKIKQFNDSIVGLTVFVEGKDENNVYENIFIRDDGKILSTIGVTSSTIFARTGKVSEDEKKLILYNGNIQKLKKDGSINVVKFEKTEFNIDGLSTKSISDPKVQETSTIDILLCVSNKSVKTHNCQNNRKSFINNIIEVNKRLGMPIYIPLIALVCSFLLSSRKDKKIYVYNKYIYFIISFFILVLAEMIVRYSGKSLVHTGVYYLAPLILMILFYFTLIKKFKYENLS